MLIALLIGHQATQAQDFKDSTLVYSVPNGDSNQRVQRKIYKSALDKEVNYSARDSIKIRVNEKKIYLYGDAMVDYKTMNIRAAVIFIDFEKNVMDATYLEIGRAHV